jgi:RNA polymerase sigma-70 factor, ECF subfamily
VGGAICRGDGWSRVSPIESEGYGAAGGGARGEAMDAGVRTQQSTVDPEIERRWIEGVRRGEQAAFEAVVRGYGPALVRFAYGLLRNEAEAEDVVQVVFWRIWERRAAWTVKAPLKSYLYSGVRNGVLNVLRGRHTRRQHALEVRQAAVGDPELGATPDASEALVAHESEVARVGALRDAFLGLTERQQTAVRLRYEEGMSYRELAAVLNVTESGVDQLLGRAMRMLRAAIRRPEAG